MASSHAKISWWKSGWRIAGYLFLLFSHNWAVIAAALWLLAAEVLGIIEEVGY